MYTYKVNRRMRFIYLSIAILGCCLFSTAALQAQSGRPISMMTFEEAYLDLGKVKKGEKRHFEYTFTNIGKEDIEIDLISACECTETDYPAKSFAPGEKGKIKVTFDSSKKDAEETIDIDIFLKNTDPNTGGPVVERIQYHFDIEK